MLELKDRWVEIAMPNQSLCGWIGLHKVVGRCSGQKKVDR